MTAFSPKQRTVLSWWVPGNPNRDREAIVCDGAVRSGKTLAMGLSFFLWAMSCFSGQKFGVCGKTIASLRRNVLSEILPKLEALGAKWKEKRTDNLLTVKFRGRENQFYVFGGRDESSASLIQGAAGRGGADAPQLCGAGMRPVLRRREPVMVQLQPCRAGALVLPDVDSGGGEAELSAAPLYHGGQPHHQRGKACGI